MSQLLEDARALRDLFEDPRHWTQGYSALDACGHPVSPEDPNAVCWCLTGGISHIAKGTRGEWETAREVQLYHLVKDLHLADQMPWLVLWNDHCKREHQDILALCDKAVERAAAIDQARGVADSEPS